MYLLQSEDTRGFFTKVLHFCIGNWEKALILGILITLIVLVSVKVTNFTHSPTLHYCTMEILLLLRIALILLQCSYIYLCNFSS